MGKTVCGNFVLLKLQATILVNASDGGKGVVRDAMVAKELATLGKAFLYQKAHAHDLRTGLAAKVDDAAGGVTIGQKIVDKDNPSMNEMFEIRSVCSGGPFCTSRGV